MHNETLKVRGMICRPCEDAIASGLLSLQGVRTVEAHYWKGDVAVTYDSDIVTRDDVVSRLAAIGYPEGRAPSGVVTDIVCLMAVFVVLWLLQVISGIKVPAAEAGASYGFLFIVGLLTSIHCLAMCGGIELSQTTDAAEMLAGDDGTHAVEEQVSTASGKKRRSTYAFKSALAYNGGRMVSYAAVGAVFGAAGVMTSYTPTVKAIVFTVAGVLVLLIGLRMFGLMPPLPRLHATRRGARASSSLRSSAVGARGRKRFGPLVVGLATGLMPCGALAAMWLFAMSTGSALSGALSMLAFAAGTVPAMLLLGSFSSLVPRRWLRYLLRVGAILVMAMGLSMAIKGLRMF